MIENNKIIKEDKIINEEERIEMMKKDIKNLKEKLIYTSTKDVKARWVEGKNQNEIDRKIEERNLRNILKSKLLTLEIIRKAQEV